MAYSNQTTHYGLPLPVGSDKSTWLDTNTAFQAIDSALYTAASEAGSQSSAVTTLQSEMATAQSNISSNTSAITAESTARQSADTTLTNSVSSINTLLGSTSISSHGDGTVTGILNDLITDVDKFISGHTPTALTYTAQSITNVSTNTFEVYADDYFVSINGVFTLTTSMAATSSISTITSGTYYGVVLGTIPASEISAAFPNIVKGTPYLLGYAIAHRTPGRVLATTSGDIADTNAMSTLPISFWVASNGVGYIGVISTSALTYYTKRNSTASLGHIMDAAVAVEMDINNTVMKHVSYDVPDPE